MDLHINRFSNPLWDDGKAMEDMWRRKLGDDIPNKDRQKDTAHTIEFRDKQPLYATFTAEHPIALRKNPQRSLSPPTSAKRPHASCDGDTEHPPSKRSRFNRGSDERQVGSLASP